MASLPTIMKAVTLTALGGPEKPLFSEYKPVPRLQPGQVLIKNAYSGINFVDVYYRTGVYPSASLPTIIGQEGAGTIVATSGPNPLGLDVGDHCPSFWSMRATSQGHLGEGCRPVFLMGMAATSLIQTAYSVQKRQTVLIHAAAGGVGLLLCQILRDVGAIIIGTAGGPEKCALAKENGARHVIDYKAASSSSWVERVMELTNGSGVDVVYDSVGKDTWEGSMDVAKRNGKVVIFGEASGPVPDIPMQKLGQKNVSMMRAALKNMIATRPELELYANAAFGLVKSGKVQVRIHREYSLRQVSEAHVQLEGRKTMGKLLIKL
ncbi:Uncharacterized protein BP5553_00492 [Venustampulla echinocandica]|uniref:Probable quinone oxidoreductase n=1 Tax=Venustampulla echinocandica TaxID=2656787 RepID=A0A370TYC3_9HELO|nr:Uncharacterized protein BP5553_00492 [Venustampulla echinocandica]RDL40513.1 Uncharacterized protein BP5553_00492 [Venustampulla echinocandica]